MAESFKKMFDKPFFGRFVNDLSLVLQNMSVDKFMPTEYKEAVAKIFKLLDCVKVRLLDFSKIDDKNFNLLTLEYGVILDHYDHFSIFIDKGWTSCHQIVNKSSPIPDYSK